MNDLQLQEDMEKVEIDIEDARTTINRMEMLRTLMATQAWQEIIEEGYFRDEASRLVLLKADPEMYQERQQAEISKSINAIGPFRQYLRVIMQLGMMSEHALQNDEQTREELLEEEANMEEDD